MIFTLDICKIKAGGIFGVNLDGKQVALIGSADEQNRFVWKKIATLPLKLGS